MSQATLTERPYVNANLFSGHYLDERVQDREEWECDEAAEEALTALQSLYEMEGGLVDGYGEDALVDNWIDGVLDVLGYGTQKEVTLPDGGGYVDELLFADGAARRDAAEVYLKTEDTTDLFEGGLGLVEAKQWDADFTAEFSESRQYRNASHQIKHYLEKTPSTIQWGILTNGRKWRLYGTKDYETQTYYEVDLPELLETGDLERFKYFYAFFRPEAFRESAGTTFLDEVRSESETASKELGEDLQDNVFTALRILGRGFVETNDMDIDPDDEEALDELKEQSLVLLYRLMFVLYAEARGLIHPEDPSAQSEYEENFSLDALRLEIHEEIGEADEGFDTEFSEYATGYWGRLEDLFRLIDEGEEDLGIPPYNGGLFDHDKHDFLTEHEVSNRYLAEVIYRLSTTENDEGRYVLADYADLDTRHLGSVYEGLLEHQFRIAPEQYAAVSEDGGQIWEPADEVTVADAVETVPEGGLYVVNDEGERKATGAYYTPDYVVTYIVEETIGPLVEEIHEDLQAQGFERGTQEYIGPFIRRVTDLQILDPAMGSGHFLTRATEYLANEVMVEVREVESAMGVAINEQQMRRDIAKECIYGVDINGMAVELAKLSMWLETLATDQPLAFLDHHLKAGNSLVGSDVTEVLSEDDEEDDGQLTLTQAFGRVRRDTLDHVMDLMADLLAMDNETLEDVHSMEDLYAEIQDDPLYRRLFELTNVHTAEQFGVDVPEDAYEQMADAIEDEGEWAAIQGEDWFADAQALADEQTFFHWELEYPGVFFDEDGEERDDAGFDAVIGNPPWLNAWGMTDKMPELREAIGRLYDDTGLLEGHWDLFIPFIVQGLELCREAGRHSYILPNPMLTEKYGTELRHELLTNNAIESLLSFGELDVFEDVDRQYFVYVIRSDTVSPEKEKLRLTNSVTPFQYDELTKIEHDVWIEAYNHQIRVSSEFMDGLPILKKIEEKSIKLGDFFYVNYGAQVSSQEKGAFAKDDVVSESFEGDGEKFFEGKDVSRFHLGWRGLYLDYRPGEMYGPRSPELFECDKIVVSVRTSKNEQLKVAIDQDRMYCDHTVIICADYTDVEDSNLQLDFEEVSRKDRSLNKWFTLAQLNSSVVNWVFQNKFATGALQGSYSDVWPATVRSLPIFSIEKIVDCDFNDSSDLETDEERAGALSSLAKEMSDNNTKLQKLNLSLLDHLGSYSDGPTLADVGLTQPPEGAADSILTQTTEERPNLRVGEATVARESPTAVEIRLTARYKPDDEDAHETDQWGYTETEPLPALRISDLTEAEADLIEHFVPVAVDEAGGFADFRETATKTNSPVDRLRKLTLPAVDDVQAGLESYIETTERAAELEAKIERTDDLIDEIVYELYGLTDEEIEIVEEAVGE